MKQNEKGGIMKTSITLNKKDIEEIIAQRLGVGVECVVLSTPMEMVGYGQNEHEAQTISGVVNLDNPVYDSDEKRKYITEFISGVTPVDTVPVVYADVTEQGGNEWWACGNCNCWSNNMLIVEYKRPNYCPNCGAKFRWKDGEYGG